MRFLYASSIEGDFGVVFFENSEETVEDITQYIEKNHNEPQSLTYEDSWGNEEEVLFEILEFKTVEEFFNWCIKKEFSFDYDDLKREKLFLLKD